MVTRLAEATRRIPPERIEQMIEKLSGVPLRVTRLDAWELILKPLLGDAAPKVRTLERTLQHLPRVYVNGRATHDPRDVVATAMAMIETAPGITGGLPSRARR